MSYIDLPIKDGLIGHFEADQYDGSNIWLPSYGNLVANIYNGAEITKNHTIYLKEHMRQNQQSHILINIPNSIDPICTYLVAKVKGFSYQEKDFFTTWGRTGDLRVSSNHIYFYNHFYGVSRGSIENDENFHIFCISSSHFRNNFLLDGEVLVSSSADLSIDPRWVGQIQINNENYSSMEIKELIIFRDNHNIEASLKNIKVLGEKYNIPIKDNYTLNPRTERLQSIAIAYTLIKNLSKEKTFEKKCGAYRAGVNNKVTQKTEVKN